VAHNRKNTVSVLLTSLGLQKHKLNQWIWFTLS